MPTVLIGPGPLRNKPGPFREILSAAGFDTFLDPPGDHNLTEADLRECLPQCDAMLAGGEPIPGTLLALAPKLRAIARTGVGYDAIDLTAATARNIPVMITPGTNHESVAEQTFALLLAVSRNVVGNDRLIKGGGWNRDLVRPIRGSTIGLVGLGRIGKSVATRALAFGMKVVVFDPIPDSDFEERHGLARLSFDELLSTADVVSLHLPLTPTTLGLICAETLALMKPGAILINTSRGGLVAEPDLYDSLKTGRLAGAGLDVLCSEPPDPGNPLLTLSNVIVSPHVGGIDSRAMADMAELAASCVAALKQGRWPSGCVVNEQIAPGWTW